MHKKASPIEIRENTIRKCAEIRASLERMRIEPESTERSAAIAELERSAALWRKELDRVW
jgi:hypothetical protein